MNEVTDLYTSYARTRLDTLIMGEKGKGESFVIDTTYAENLEERIKNFDSEVKSKNNVLKFEAGEFVKSGIVKVYIDDFKALDKTAKDAIKNLRKIKNDVARIQAKTVAAGNYTREMSQIPKALNLGMKFSKLVHSFCVKQVMTIYGGAKIGKETHEVEEAYVSDGSLDKVLESFGF